MAEVGDFGAHRGKSRGILYAQHHHVRCPLRMYGYLDDSHADGHLPRGLVYRIATLFRGVHRSPLHALFGYVLRRDTAADSLFRAAQTLPLD